MEMREKTLATSTQNIREPFSHQNSSNQATWYFKAVYKSTYLSMYIRISFQMKRTICLTLDGVCGICLKR